MKKVLAIVFIASLAAVSCSKKEEKSLQDSNIMLEEPAAPTVADSTSTKTDSAPVAAPAPAAVDTTAAK
ncbi:MULTISPECIES: hypothetical protein [Chryseobacterium]|uniref:Uncharacterized protein n=1 Tax=Chryseobacterium taihuense TaxID=1141221 RepID=A0A4U8WDI3_9FLAO|nr:MULTISPECIES: hypothetical protein [Chryseobacterium]QQV03715.1 hypothetical protein I6I61_05085 [Chryseobacterium sp. FDAARGOS 1104]VFB02945.1 Uncharacterised protein [Chryseobacterium taihuense]